MIEVRNLSKRYGKLLANDSVSMRVEPGELNVLLGPNGAGKSTLIKCVCGLLRYEGEITIGGHDNRTPDAKRLLGYVPEMPALYPMLTVDEHMQFIAKAYRLRDWQGRAASLLERFELDDKRKKLGKELSKGMQQKLSLCIAAVTGPKAMILDEPMVGLDPHAIRELKQLLVELRQDGCALIVSTHMIDSVEDNWDATHIMMGGKVARVLKRSELRGESLESAFFAITEGSGQHA